MKRFAITLALAALTACGGSSETTVEPVPPNPASLAPGSAGAFPSFDPAIGSFVGTAPAGLITLRDQFSSPVSAGVQVAAYGGGAMVVLLNIDSNGRSVNLNLDDVIVRQGVLGYSGTQQFAPTADLTKGLAFAPTGAGPKSLVDFPGNMGGGPAFGGMSGPVVVLAPGDIVRIRLRFPTPYSDPENLDPSTSYSVQLPDGSGHALSFLP